MEVKVELLWRRTVPSTPIIRPTIGLCSRLSLLLKKSPGEILNNFFFNFSARHDYLPTKTFRDRKKYVTRRLPDQQLEAGGQQVQGADEEVEEGEDAANLGGDLQPPLGLLLHRFFCRCSSQFRIEIRPPVSPAIYTLQISLSLSLSPPRPPLPLSQDSLPHWLTTPKAHTQEKIPIRSTRSFCVCVREKENDEVIVEEARESLKRMNIVPYVLLLIFHMLPGGKLYVHARTGSTTSARPDTHFYKKKCPRCAKIVRKKMAGLCAQT